MKTPYVNFKELKQAVSITRVLDHYSLTADMKARGDSLQGNCPICDTDNPRSFRVSQEKNCFKCFSCGEGGNMLDLVSLIEDCSIREAATLIAEWTGFQSERPRREPRQRASRSEPRKPESKKEESATEDEQPAAKVSELEVPKENPPLTFELKLDNSHPWFAEVGLEPETVEHFGLGYCAKGMMAGRICFPLKDSEAQLIGYAGYWPEDPLPEGKARWKFPEGLKLDRVVFSGEPVSEDGLRQFLSAPDPLQVVLAWQFGISSVVALLGNHPEAVGLRSVSISLGLTGAGP